MPLLELAASSALMGVAGSASIDVWALALRRAFNVSSLDYRFLGRWIGHLPHGRYRHQRIQSAAPVPGERLLGWVAHYGIGVGFAAVLLLLAGENWANAPTPGPALLMGVGTVVAPWFVLQPAFGAGFAGAKTAHPWHGRLRNLGTHTVYGLGLYASALVVAWR